MPGPKHLWSGDWEQESADARPVPRAAEPEPPPAPQRTTPRRPALSLVAAVGSLVAGIAVIAVAAIVILSTHHHTPVSAGNTGAATTVPAATRRFTVPTTPVAARSAQPIVWLGMKIVDGPSHEAVVDTVSATGAGHRAGVHAGDVIESIAGHAVAGPQGIAAALRGAHAGDQVPIQVFRNASTRGLRITLGASPRRSP